MRIRPLPTMIAAALLMAAAGTSGATAAPARGDATGFGVLMDGSTYAAARASTAGRTQRSATASRLAGPAGTVGRAEIVLGASAEGSSGAAEGTARARDVNLFGGRVVAAAVTISVRAKARTGGGEAGLVDYSASGLLVDGRPVEMTPGARVEISGVGVLTLAEQVADPTGAVRANALRVEVTDASSGLPPGAQVVVGHLEAVAASGDAPAAPPPPAAPAPPAADGGYTPAPPRPPLPAPTLPRVRARALPPPITIPRLAPTPTPLLPRQAPPVGASRTLPEGAYAFPVVGDSSYTDDYGAPRAGTGWHHGNDIFAPIGAPVLAVADGTLFNVGVNTLGGNRLWLRDERGNTYYYAHLSAYAPSAVEGAKVKGGEVIGFVGNTGQAITTPPHLHFEIHPGDGDSVNPYAYLLAWERGTEVPQAFRAAEVSQGQAPAAGALLVAFSAAPDEAPADADGLAEAVP